MILHVERKFSATLCNTIQISVYFHRHLAPKAKCTQTQQEHEIGRRFLCICEYL